MFLSGTQRQRLLQALLSAFPSRSNLQIMLAIQLEVALNEISDGQNLRTTAFEVIGWMEAQGRLEDLIRGARRDNAGNPSLKQFANEFEGDPAQQPRRAFERWIQETNKFQDPYVWIKRLTELLPRVCRIQVGSDVFGTGFLLGPDAIITNYHVVEDVIQQNGFGPNDVVFTFDYHRSADGKEPGNGKEYRLKSSDWLIDSSAYSPADSLVNPPEPPHIDQLDYALLRTEGAPGNQKIGGTEVMPELRPRGWISLPEEPAEFKPHTELFIVQHPQGEPLQLALNSDALLGLNENKTRVRYTTNTLGGSSGSPCFNAEWELQALHHSGDPNFNPGYKPGYNQGIPFTLIRTLLEQRGKLKDGEIV